ncbi:hypothetical protein J5N97_030301 [Dioscorea zingiberensis]|uniref:Uncharacterized protein n=1 Tax=Dioscorea zingiberensis TaxID=325984 RepID=A0A9D5BXC6_9LILI|nr:hypothetical protein J5N97_030301 [Dioscorea zingiberensis]
MASAAAAIDQATPPKPVEESLWWDSFVILFEELDAAPLSSDLPDRLMEKLKNNHAWFLNSVSSFRPPSQVSKAALDSPQISIGSHRLSVKPELKEVALRIGARLCLDEVQSYILVDRSSVLNKSVADFDGQKFLHLAVLQYFLERQCLLKCIRRIFMHALDITNGSRGEAMKLIHDGLEKKLLTISRDLLSSVSLDKKEVDFITLWVEETLIEDNLILDVLFLCHYCKFQTCCSEQWKTLCSLFKEHLSGSDNLGKLAASVEAKNSLSHAKARLLLILIETLDLENLLCMVHDQVLFRQGNIVFSWSEIQEIDAVVSSFSTLGLVEAGPLILAWATFLCLLLSLPDSKDYNLLSEISHIAHVRQAFELGPFNYVLKILHMDSLRDLDKVTGSSRGNSLLQNQAGLWILAASPLKLRHAIPAEDLSCYVRLSQGEWSAKCVYKFLSKMSGVTSLFEIPHGSRVNVHDTVVTRHQLNVLGIDIPIGSRGSILRIVDSNLALVRWEFKCSGVILLLLHMAQSSFSVNNEETCLALNLFCRMMSFNMAVTSALLNIEFLFPAQVDQIGGVVDKFTRIDMVEIICSLILNLAHDVSNAVSVSICIKILALMLKCAPSHVIEVASRMHIFGTENTGTSSVLGLLSGGFARMLLADYVREDFSLTTSVLDFTMQLLEIGAENDMVAALVVFSLQFILVNHVHWRYKYKYSCLELTLKLLELMKSCTRAMHVSVKFHHIVGDILLNDSSVHNIICCVLCNSAEYLENLSLSSHHELKEIKCLQLAVCSTLDIIFSLLADLSGEIISSTPAFLRMLFSSATKPFPVVTVAVSLISSCHNPAIQVAAVRVLSMLCFVASKVQPYIFENVSFPANYLQICYLRRTLCHIIDGEMNGNEDLIIAIIVLLVYAARVQDIVFRAKMTVCLCAIHLMCKLLTSDGGCLSISLIEKLRTITKKLSEHPSFSALLAQYSSSRL